MAIRNMEKFCYHFRLRRDSLVLNSRILAIIECYHSKRSRHDREPFLNGLRILEDFGGDVILCSNLSTLSLLWELLKLRRIRSFWGDVRLDHSLRHQGVNMSQVEDSLIQVMGVPLGVCKKLGWIGIQTFLSLSRRLRLAHTPEMARKFRGRGCGFFVRGTKRGNWIFVQRHG